MDIHMTIYVLGIYLQFKTVRFVATVFHVKKKTISILPYSGS